MVTRKCRKICFLAALNGPHSAQEAGGIIRNVAKSTYDASRGAWSLGTAEQFVLAALANNHTAVDAGNIVDQAAVLRMTQVVVHGHLALQKNLL